ncbi:hypothetical protein [Arthrobacter sp. D5-1]|uniref:hypothetical protein n=1 Tax=Arthrobacter sp. D5-1 TaxID=1477518 RepID=UPI001A98AAF7|nr:hypothetical protein [Arthrobacter sp. D5-1]
MAAFYQPSDRLALIIATSGVILCLLTLSFMHARALSRSYNAQRRSLEFIRDTRAKQSKRELEILELIRDSRVKQSRKEFEIIELIRDSRLKQSRKEYQILTAIDGFRPQLANLRTMLEEVSNRIAVMEHREEAKGELMNRGFEEQREVAVAEERRAQQAIRRLFGAVLEGQNQILTQLETSQRERHIRGNDE